MWYQEFEESFETHFLLWSTKDLQNLLDMCLSLRNNPQHIFASSRCLRESWIDRWKTIHILHFQTRWCWLFEECLSSFQRIPYDHIQEQLVWTLVEWGESINRLVGICGKHLEILKFVKCLLTERLILVSPVQYHDTISLDRTLDEPQPFQSARWYYYYAAQFHCSTNLVHRVSQIWEDLCKWETLLELSFNIGDA